MHFTTTSFCSFHFINGVKSLGSGIKYEPQVAYKVMLIKKSVPKKKTTRKRNS